MLLINTEKAAVWAHFFGHIGWKGICSRSFQSQSKEWTCPSGFSTRKFTRGEPYGFPGSAAPAAGALGWHLGTLRSAACRGTGTTVSRMCPHMPRCVTVAFSLLLRYLEPQYKERWWGRMDGADLLPLNGHHAFSSNTHKVAGWGNLFRWPYANA